MDMEKAVLLTTIMPATDRICDHGCRDVVEVTNVCDGTTWRCCLLSFERFLERSLATIDDYSRGHSPDSTADTG